MIPDIVAEKIGWYVWRMKQREICDEYRVSYYRTKEGAIKMSTNKQIILYNWRKKNLEDKMKNLYIVKYIIFLYVMTDFILKWEIYRRIMYIVK